MTDKEQNTAKVAAYITSSQKRRMEAAMAKMGLNAASFVRMAIIRLCEAEGQ